MSIDLAQKNLEKHLGTTILKITTRYHNWSTRYLCHCYDSTLRWRSRCSRPKQRLLEEVDVERVLPQTRLAAALRLSIDSRRARAARAARAAASEAWLRTACTSPWPDFPHNSTIFHIFNVFDVFWCLFAWSSVPRQLSCPADEKRKYIAASNPMQRSIARNACDAKQGTIRVQGEEHISWLLICFRVSMILTRHFQVHTRVPKWFCQMIRSKACLMYLYDSLSLG